MNFEILKQGQSRLQLYQDPIIWEERKCAMISAFEFANAKEGRELVSLAIETSKRNQAQGLVAPMSGDTWHSYRTWTQSDGSPPFLLEPQSTAHDRAVLEDLGFDTIAQFFSSRGRLEDAIAPEIVVKSGVNIQAWDGKDGKKLVDKIFEISKESFAKNPFFKPITKQEFHEIYDPMLYSLDPRLVLLAHDDGGDFCGFVFGYGDALNPQTKTVVLKTYASTMRGVGFALADQFHRTALNLGYENVIHALMHEDNPSFQRSQLHKAEIFRRYALFAKTWD